MRRHAFDPVSAVAGLLFLAIAIVALGPGIDARLLASGRLWSVLLLGLGVILLVAAVTRRPDGESIKGPGPVEQVDEGVPEPLTDVEAAIAELGSDDAPEESGDSGL